MKDRRLKNPTTTRTKIVATDDKSSRVLRTVLLRSLRLIREEVRLPTSVTGDLSTWILQLHGLKAEGRTIVAAQSNPPNVTSLVEWMEQIVGPEADPRTIRTMLAKLEGAKDQRTTGELTSLYRQDPKRFLSEFTKQADKVATAANIAPELVKVSGFSSFEDALKMQRASRALVICVTLHKIHPVSLIVRAASGDRRAVLDLVKIDRLFLHDRCTEEVIKKAELQNDRRFLEQLARAQTFAPKLSARGIQHFYFYHLLLMEQAGTKLPANYELWRILDPNAHEYKSPSGFERDFQRCRETFEQILNEFPPLGAKILRTRTEEVVLENSKLDRS